MSGIPGYVEEQVRSAVRSVVKEELSAHTGRSSSGTQSLVERTRKLIHASASSVS